MSVPPTARVVVIGAGIVGNSLVYHLARLGWRDIVQIDKGALPNPGGSTGHASNFIFPVDHSREMTDLTLDSMRQYKELGVFTESGGFEVARSEERMEELRRRMSSATRVGHRGRARDARPGRRPRPVPGEGPDHRRVLDAVGRRGRLAARGHDHARARDGARRAHRRAERRGDRPGRRAGPHPAGAHHRRRHRGRDGGDRLRRLEPEDRQDGGRGHPAHPRRAPDDLGGPDPAARRAAGRDLVPDRPGHGHVLLRAPARRRHGGGLLRPPRDPARPERDPVDRAGEALAHRDAVHGRRLRPAAGAGARAHARRAGRRGRGDPLRHQRPALPDPGRPSDPRRDARRSRACGRPRLCGSRRAPAPRARSRSG